MQEQIQEALSEGKEFTAVKLILYTEHNFTATEATRKAWELGPIGGQELISDWIVKYEVFG